MAKINDMKGSVACMFPGQGSQYPGMGRVLAENFAAARAVFEEADDALGFSLSRLCFEGSAEDLQLTENTQPAILTVSVAAWRAFEGEFPDYMPKYVAGHSLGEYSALVAVGALSLADAVRTVRARGRYMQEAVPVGVGAMAAILGADWQVVLNVCKEAQQGEVCSPANINSAQQVVIAGHATAIDRAITLVKERGAKKVVQLKVSAPFHCALMETAQRRLAADLSELKFNYLRCPLITNVDAIAIRGGSEARDALVRQVSSPVRWLETLELLIGAGVRTFVEFGPGKVLSALARKTIPDANCFNVEDAASLHAARTGLNL